MRQTLVPAKKVNETLLITFNFFDQLLFGEVLSAPVVTAEVFSGLDYNPGSVISGPATFSGSIVTQKVSGGMAGVTYALTATVTGSLGHTYQVTQTMAVLSQTGFAPASFPSLTGTLPDGVVGAFYTHNLQILGGYPPYSPIGFISGAPAWMGFTVVDDELICFGTPDIEATYNFSPEIVDSALSHASAPQSIDIEKVFITGDAPNGEENAFYSYTYTFGSGTPPLVFSISSGALPTGITLNTATAEISGIPATQGTYNWTIRVTDANGVIDEQPDSSKIVLALFFSAVFATPFNKMTRSLDGGASFVLMNGIGGPPPPGNNGCLASACGNFLYYFNSDNQFGYVDRTKYSTTGVELSFLPVAYVDTPPPFFAFPGPQLMAFKAPSVPSEIRFYANDGDDLRLYYTTDGVNFRSRLVTYNPPTPAGAQSWFASSIAHDQSGRAVQRNSDYFNNVHIDLMNCSNDSGITWTIYHEPRLRQLGQSGVMVLHNGSQFMLFGICDPNPPFWTVTESRLGLSTTGVEGSWTFISVPWGGDINTVGWFPVVGLVVPGSNRVVVILSNREIYYSDSGGAVGTWVLATTVPGTGTPSHGLANGDAGSFNEGRFILAGGYYYYFTNNSGWNRIKEDFTGGWQVISVTPPGEISTRLTAFTPP